MKQGAAALLCERSMGLGVPEVVVDDVRQIMAHMAAALYGHPSKKIEVVAVTGTNGKTTVVAMLAAILKQAGHPVRTLGTLSVPDTLSAPSLTTPDAISLQAELAAAVVAGEKVVMEVSSHGLLQHRVAAVSFKVCVFTNLSQDHLDYHATMEDYFRAKQSLFNPASTSCAVINTDTSYGQRLIEEMPADIGFRTCSRADAEAIEMSMSQTRFVWEGREITLRPVSYTHLTLPTKRIV